MHLGHDIIQLVPIRRPDVHRERMRVPDKLCSRVGLVIPWLGLHILQAKAKAASYDLAWLGFGLSPGFKGNFSTAV
jgi:hypothetical protein